MCERAHYSVRAPGVSSARSQAPPRQKAFCPSWELAAGLPAGHKLILFIVLFLVAALNPASAAGIQKTQTFTMALWGFYIFAIAAILILLAKVYKKTHDTGYQDLYRI